MAFISKAAHQKFKTDMERFLATAVDGGSLSSNMQELELLFDAYTKKIEQLHDNIVQYERLQRSIRAVVRRQKVNIQRVDK